MSGLISSAGSKSGVIGYSGDIVDSGSNANGEYIKYSDGTMICRYHELSTSARVSCTVQMYNAGSKYYGNKVYTYPVAFVNTTSITATASADPSSANCVASIEAYPNVSTINIAVWADRSTTTAGYICYVAIGKWK